MKQVTYLHLLRIGFRFARLIQLMVELLPPLTCLGGCDVVVVEQGLDDLERQLGFSRGSLDDLQTGLFSDWVRSKIAEVTPI